jgi:hypothetical protein
MKRIIAFLTVFCALCGSAFAAVTISDWGICGVNGDTLETIVYEGLIDDISPTGFTFHANSEMWADKSYPPAAFISENVSPGLIVNRKTTTFGVSFDGFGNDFIQYWKSVTDPNDIQRVEKARPYILSEICIAFIGANPDYIMVYKTDWKGNVIHEFGFEQFVDGTELVMKDSSFEVSAIEIELRAPHLQFNDYHYDGYYLGDNTAGTVEFIFPDAEVPEPSSLLALAFGGAGTALALRRRK